MRLSLVADGTRLFRKNQLLYNTQLQLQLQQQSVQIALKCQPSSEMRLCHLTPLIHIRNLLFKMLAYFAGIIFYQGVGLEAPTWSLW